MIEISDVKFNEANLEKGLIGFASCIINNAIYLGNIGVFTRLDKKGYRLVFPIRKSGKGMKFKICFPINNETYVVLLNAITKEVNKL